MKGNAYTFISNSNHYHLYCAKIYFDTFAPVCMIQRIPGRNLV